MRRTLLLVLLGCFVAAVPTRAQNPLAQRVLVIYDPAVPDSVTVANHYLSSRGIPSGNLCAISPLESAWPLSWSTFVSAVQTPIQNCLNAVGQNQILYIVFSYIRPFAVIAQNGRHYAMDQYIADIWNQYSTTDAFPYPDQAHPYFAVDEAQGNSYQPFLSFADYRAQQNSLQRTIRTCPTRARNIGGLGTPFWPRRSSSGATLSASPHSAAPSPPAAEPALKLTSPSTTPVTPLSFWLPRMGRSILT